MIQMSGKVMIKKKMKKLSYNSNKVMIVIELSIKFWNVPPEFIIRNIVQTLSNYMGRVQ